MPVVGATPVTLFFSDMTWDFAGKTLSLQFEQVTGLANEPNAVVVINIESGAYSGSATGTLTSPQLTALDTALTNLRKSLEVDLAASIIPGGAATGA